MTLGIAIVMHGGARQAAKNRFLRGFCAGFFCRHFCGKSAQRNPPGKPSKFMRQNPRQLSAAPEMKGRVLKDYCRIIVFRHSLHTRYSLMAEGTLICEPGLSHPCDVRCQEN